MGTRTSVVALTGGIASGKSAVAERFAALGVPVFDADHAARAVVANGTDGFNEVIAAFGVDALKTDGALDRGWLREQIFNDPDARNTLEGIVHPRVRRYLRDAVAKATGPYVMLAIPLLTETWPQYEWTDRVLVVDVPEAVQVARVMARDDIDHALARRILATQATREQRLALADDVIDNSGAESDLDAAVAALHQKYLEAGI